MTNLTEIELEGSTDKSTSTRKRKSKYPPLEVVQNQYIQQSCQDCILCPLSESRNLVVWARGENLRNIMIVGEAPGQTEDKYGLPFIGDSGKLLQNILSCIGLHVQRDCYVCNVVKCHPPDNRPPTSNETNSCFGYLVNQLIEAQPKVILAMGNSAGKVLTDEKPFSVMKLRGKALPISTKFHDYGFTNLQVLITLHPSALLREQKPNLDPGSKRWLVWQDMKKLKQLLEE